MKTMKLLKSYLKKTICADIPDKIFTFSDKDNSLQLISKEKLF
jgi:hypothetical protein